MADLDLTYDGLSKLCEPFRAEARTESRAFLQWYLENIYRLEPTAAEDSVCDGPDDKGIDGIYIDEPNSRIDILQSKTVQREGRTVGDTQIKEFAGTLGQFATPEGVANLAATTTNAELKSLLETLGVADRVRDGYEVRGVFLTNAPSDPSAPDYVANSGANIAIWDRPTIEAAYVQSGHDQIALEPITFDVLGFDTAQYKVRDAVVVVAPLLGSDLIRMEGVDSGALFDYNVRQHLGRTNVNKDIAKSISETEEHPNFLLYHNGVTIIADTVDVTPDKVTLRNYIVVNGCQSVSALWENRSKLSPDLRILARIIKIDRSSPMIDVITRISNNQNGIKARDFQSNNPIQLRLRNEFREAYPDQITYVISRGEPVPSGVQVIDNELAARVLLAFDLKEPWTSHQTYKLFDELHGPIFARPEVTASRILVLQDIYETVAAEVGTIYNSLLARYTLTKFFLVYLLREVLETDAQGKLFVNDPGPFIAAPNGRERLRHCIREVLKDLITDLNAETEERAEAGTPFDFKRDLKSESAAKGLSRDIRTAYEKAVRRDRAPSFEQLWGESAPSSE